MILYYYTGQEFLRNILQDRRIKLSRYGKYGTLNDPFELTAYDTSDQNLRRTHKQQVDVFAQKLGLICMSKTRHSPAMWAHYTNNHEGACLELEVSFNHIHKVKYRSKKLFPDISLDTFSDSVSINNIKEIWGTKSKDWSYEKERRMHVPLNADSVINEGPNYFMPFQEIEDNVFMLKRVFVGYRCGKGISNIMKDVKEYPHSIEVIQTRPSFKRFKVVNQLNKNLWNWEECEKGEENSLPAVKAVFS